MKNQFDTIVIGSGIGGMTAASILAQFYNQKVLIIEKHFTFGGLTHEFKRKGAVFSAGFHYIGGMDEGSNTKKIFDVVTNFEVAMKKMPDDYDTFVYPDFTFKASSNQKKYNTALQEKFPSEAKAIENYFKDIFRYNTLFTLCVAKKAVPSNIRPFISFAQKCYELFMPDRINPSLTLQQYLNKLFKDENIKALLASQWGDYGVIPSQGAMLMHSVIATHYIKGSWYPKDGTEKIGNAVKCIVENRGGEIILANGVEKLLMDGNNAIGVQLQKLTKEGTDKFYANNIISNIGADLTYNNLLPASGLVLPKIQAKIKGLTSKENFLSLFLTLNVSPAEFGCNGGNLWWYKYTDHTKNISSVNATDFPTAMYVSFSSLKVDKPEKYTLDVMTIVPYNDFNQWENEKWMKRGDEYNQLKNSTADKLIEQLNEIYPGIKEQIEFAEVATPLTIQNFTGRTAGSSYGLAHTPERFQQTWLSTYTPVKNLFLSGQDVSSAGIVGAMMGGVSAAGATQGATGYIKVMAKIMKYWAKNIKSFDV
jgi:all-trans-retinol 13,14-reductase